jgi:hypothetical protein
VTTTARTPRGHHVGLAVAAVAWVATGLLLLLQPQVPLDRLQLLPTTLTVVCGAIIVLRTETRLIGWLLVAAGILWPLDITFFPFGAAPPPLTPVTEFLLTLGGLGYTCLLLLLLVFPTGRLDSRLARVAAVIALLPWVVGLPMGALGAMGVIGDAATPPFAVQLAVFGVVVVLGLTMQVLRYRHRPRVEQLQLKWFLLGVGAFLVYPVLFAFGADSGPLVDLAIISVLPVAVLVAITRYRLYEIDRIVSRTLAYAIVIATLGALFVGGIGLVATVLPAQDDLAVVATTIVVVALFDPLRRRVVDAVDRRFNRTRYVAQQVIAQFGRTVQDVTDLDEIDQRVHAVIGRTIAPTTVAVWRPASPTRAVHR